MKCQIGAALEAPLLHAHGRAHTYLSPKKRVNTQCPMPVHLAEFPSCSPPQRLRALRETHAACKRLAPLSRRQRWPVHAVRDLDRGMVRARDCPTPHKWTRALADPNYPMGHSASREGVGSRTVPHDEIMSYASQCATQLCNTSEKICLQTAHAPKSAHAKQIASAPHRVPVDGDRFDAPMEPPCATRRISVPHALLAVTASSTTASPQ